VLVWASLCADASVCCCLVQGVFVKRHQISKEQDSSPLTPSDLAVGETVTVYGRTFFLVDADTFTRRWYSEQMGLELGGAGTYPADPVDAYRKHFGLDKAPSECSKATQARRRHLMPASVYKSAAKLQCIPSMLRPWTSSALCIPCVAACKCTGSFRAPGHG
jgi:hypothetical protein